MMLSITDTIIPLRELTTNSSQAKNHQTPPISPRHLTRSNTNCNGVHTNGSKNVLLPPTGGSTRRSHLRRVKLPSDSPKNNSFGFSFKGKEVLTYIIFYISESHPKTNNTYKNTYFRRRLRMSHKLKFKLSIWRKMQKR